MSEETPAPLPPHLLGAICHYIPQLGEWLDIERACEMANLIVQNKPLVVVEIGTFKGQSLIAQAFALRDNNNGGKIYGIDPWQVTSAVEGFNEEKNNEWWTRAIDLNQIHQDCMQAIWDHHLEPWTVIIRAASQHVYQLFNYNIDVLYIDGNHSEVASCRDVELFVPRVVPGGFIWFDDADWPTTQRAIGMIETMATTIINAPSYRLFQKR
jgi:predicted O-methyltransferase YrrM